MKVRNLCGRMWQKALTEGQGGVYIDVEVSPASSIQAIRGYDEWRNRIRIALKAEPKDGKANAEFVNFLSKVLDTSSDNIQITSGQTTGQKRVFVKNLGKDIIIEKLGEHLGPG